MKYRSRLSLVLIIILLISTEDKITIAEPLQQQLQEYNQSIGEDTSKLSKYKVQADELRIAIQELDNKIETALYKQNSLEEEINSINNKINESNLKIEQYNKDIEEKEAKKSFFVRNMYKFGELSYVDVIFKSDNVFDATYNLYSYSALVNASQKNIEELDNLKKDLISEQETLETNKTELEKNKADVKAIVDEMTLMKNDQQNKLNELNEVQANLIYKMENEKAAAEKINTMLQEQKLQAEAQRKKQQESTIQEETSENQQSNPSKDNNEEENTNYEISNNYTASEIVAYASQFQGVPYVWGGTTPSGFDCSGLVQYCYAQFGYYLPRVSQDQQNFGTDISLSELRTGDLVFWGRPATHVALYIDGGYILHAPNTGDVVRIQSVNLNSITSAKRIIN